MTVKELKEFLDKCDDKLEVYAPCSDDGCYWEVPAGVGIRQINGRVAVYIDDEQVF